SSSGAAITVGQLAASDLSNGTTGSGAVVLAGSPTFTGTVTIPSPFTLGATSVTSTGTQLNYLNAATGTTGTTSTNLVFSTSPTLVTPNIGVATATSLKTALIFPPSDSTTALQIDKADGTTHVVDIDTTNA